MGRNGFKTKIFPRWLPGYNDTMADLVIGRINNVSVKLGSVKSNGGKLGPQDTGILH